MWPWIMKLYRIVFIILDLQIAQNVPNPSSTILALVGENVIMQPSTINHIHTYQNIFAYTTRLSKRHWASGSVRPGSPNDRVRVFINIENITLTFRGGRGLKCKRHNDVYGAEIDLWVFPNTCIFVFFYRFTNMIHICNTRRRILYIQMDLNTNLATIFL